VKIHKIIGIVLVVLLVGSFAATSAQDSVTLQLMGFSSSQAENDALQAMIDAFEEQNPNITVELNLVPEYDTTLQAAFASGDAPNVFYIDSFRLPDLVEAGVVAEGGDNIEAPEGFYPSLLDVFTIDGSLYCPPKDFSTLALQYNTDLFDAADLEYPTADWTWDDLRAAAEALTTEDTVGLVTPTEMERWLPFLYQSGGALFDDEGNFAFNSEETQRALDFYIGMVEDGIAAPPSGLDSGWGGEAFGSGRAAMAMEGNWVIQALANDFPETNYGVSELPQGPDGDRGTMVFTVCYGVAAENDHPEESWQLVNFLTGEAGAMMVAEAGFGVMPSRSSAAETWLSSRGEEFQPFVTGADYAHRWQLPIGYADFREEFNNSMVEAMSGNLTAEEVLENSVEVGEEIAGE
jgi:multiple sugar transport system substrate-binding protein